ncbi:MAG: hypothetical protein ACI92E_000523 [Oceanicoccus sp.]|jgi:hypothetical protein
MKVTFRFLIAFFPILFILHQITTFLFIFSSGLMDISNRYPIDGAPSFMQPTFAIPIILSTIFTFAIAPSLILKYKYGTYGKSYFGSFQPSHLKWAFLAPVVFLFNLFVIHRYAQYDSIVFSYEINMSNAALLPYLIASNLISPIIEE